jgi:hypothetical protein
VTQSRGPILPASLLDQSLREPVSHPGKAVRRRTIREADQRYRLQMKTVPPSAADRFTLNVSSGSRVRSPFTATTTVPVVWPGSKTSVPDVPV